jgi:hypothetical protein
MVAYQADVALLLMIRQTSLHYTVHGAVAFDVTNDTCHFLRSVLQQFIPALTGVMAVVSTVVASCRYLAHVLFLQLQ